MKKAIVWFIAGFIAATAFSANAEVKSMIDKVVQGEYNFTIGNDLLESKAIIVDGLAYVPARLAGETSGHIVRFNEITGVKWIKKITIPKVNVLKSIEVLNDAIVRNTAGINDQKLEISKLKEQEQTPLAISKIRVLQENVERLQADSIGCHEQIAKLNQTLADIDAQEAELAK